MEAQTSSRSLIALVLLCLSVSVAEGIANKTSESVVVIPFASLAKNQTQDAAAVVPKNEIDERKFDGPEIMNLLPVREKRNVFKRQVQAIESEIKCNEIQAPRGPGVHLIREIESHGYTFFFKPLDDFQRLILNMFIDNKFDIAKPYISDDSITISKDDFKNYEDEWIEIKVEYYINKITGRDKLALRAIVKNRTYSMVTPRWWRTHTYEGFTISSSGGASFLLDCFASAVAPLPSMNKPLILGGILGACCLLVITGWVLFFFNRRHPRHIHCEDHPPEVPPLPASLLLGTNKVNKCPDGHHIYEEFDEDTLARLRQKMNPETLGKCGASKEAMSQSREYEVPLRTPFYKDTVSPEGRQICGPNTDSVYANEINISLIEEKLKASCRNSVPESHYVEMHGILDLSPKDSEK